MGKPSQARLELQKAVDVTSKMARQFIDTIKVLDVPHIVAPYEADAQLVYLEWQGIISEDSDLLGDHSYQENMALGRMCPGRH